MDTSTSDRGFLHREVRLLGTVDHRAGKETLARGLFCINPLKRRKERLTSKFPKTVGKHILMAENE